MPNTKETYIQPPITLGHVTGVIDPRVNQKYPPILDLRQQKRITPVEDQGDRNDCWIYATYASLESSIMPSEQVDYSEIQLNAQSGFDAPPGSGGNYYMAAAILARWAGPVRETVYDNPNNKTKNEKHRIDRLVQRVIFLPNRSAPLDNNTIKFFLTNHGAIYADMHKNMEYFSKKTHSFYCTAPLAVNHAITVVGWDDNYPAKNFNSPPPGDGAFIIKNSYGTEFGDDGFFYISYYDQSFRVGACFNSAQNTDTYIRNYQYDPLGHTSNIGFMDVTAWAANVFIAADDNPLKAVAFYTNDANVSIEIYIYTNVSGNSPINGQSAAVKKCKKIYPGYYTEILDSLVPLKKNDKFSVVIKFTNSIYSNPIPEECPIPGHSSRANARPGQSFVSPDGSDWIDLTTIKPNSNVCIKAFSAHNS